MTAPGKALKTEANAEDDSSRRKHQPSWFPMITTTMGYAILIIFGHFNDLLHMFGLRKRDIGAPRGKQAKMAPLLNDWEDFYTRRLYKRIEDCWNRPIDGPAYADMVRVGLRDNQAANVDSSDGISAVKAQTLMGSISNCINLGSYNYLGFADDWHSTCRDAVVQSVTPFHISTCAPQATSGKSKILDDLESTVAGFVGKEAAMVFNMGYGTNATAIPELVGKGGLIVSDSLNHTSIVNGARKSGAVIRVFKHNDPRSLEAVLRNAIEEGQPRSHRAWKKILVMVEGIYSMEGEIVNLPAIVEVAKRYKAYIYLDEAHSIGAIGKTGRGVCEYWGVDTKDIDIMMGTFTKSFGAMGGYIAGDRALISHLRRTSAGSLYSTAMSPVVARQVLRAFEVLMGLDGTKIGQQKLQALRDNSNYFRQRLIDMGCEILGDWDSPVIPMVLYNPAKVAAFSRECFKRNLAVVVVGFPATPLLSARARFCVSAGHTQAALDEALAGIASVADICGVRYARSACG